VKDIHFEWEAISVLNFMGEFSSSRIVMDNRDVLLLFFLTSVAFCIRFWRLFYPNEVVFDECYFGNFSNYYILSQFYYDIHPPLAKIVAFVFANLSEYDASIDFEHTPNGRYQIGDYVMLRITPALFSALKRGECAFNGYPLKSSKRCLRLPAEKPRETKVWVCAFSPSAWRPADLSLSRYR
jgi:hypothetical protein